MDRLDDCPLQRRKLRKKPPRSIEARELGHATQLRHPAAERVEARRGRREALDVLASELLEALAAERVGKSWVVVQQALDEPRAVPRPVDLEPLARGEAGSSSDQRRRLVRPGPRPAGATHPGPAQLPP